MLELHRRVCYEVLTELIDRADEAVNCFVAGLATTCASLNVRPIMLTDHYGVTEFML